jgi:hypothetical protein
LVRQGVIDDHVVHRFGPVQQDFLSAGMDSMVVVM